jgi:hypothetical protein
MSAGRDSSGKAPEPGRLARSRGRLLRDAVVGTLAVGGGLEAAAVTSRAATRTRLTQQDAKILNFLLRLEQVEQSFFARAAHDARFGADVRQFASVAAAQDGAHEDALRSMLGAAAQSTTATARARPRTDAEFVQDALDLKEAAVAAYIGEAANLSRDLVTRVSTIVSVEARHAAWIRSIADVIPAPRAADRSQTPAAVLRSLQGRGLAPTG